MKKLLLVLCCFTCLLCASVVTVKAETIEEPTIETVIEEKVNSKIVDWVTENVKNETVRSIILYIITSGLGVSIIVLIAKDIKEKKLSKETMQKIVDGAFATAYNTANDKQKEQIDELKNSIETLKKAFILAQDGTAKGKIAIVELLTSEQNKEVAKETTETIEKKEEEIQEVIQELNKEYKEIF